MDETRHQVFIEGVFLEIKQMAGLLIPKCISQKETPFTCKWVIEENFIDYLQRCGQVKGDPNWMVQCIKDSKRGGPLRPLGLKGQQAVAATVRRAATSW